MYLNALFGCCLLTKTPRRCRELSLKAPPVVLELSCLLVNEQTCIYSAEQKKNPVYQVYGLHLAVIAFVCHLLFREAKGLLAPPNLTLYTKPSCRNQFQIPNLSLLKMSSFSCAAIKEAIDCSYLKELIPTWLIDFFFCKLERIRLQFGDAICEEGWPKGAPKDKK